jgi:predicted transposase YbfD/YdcC
VGYRAAHLLAQQAVEGAPGEVRAASELLKLLDIEGATVTADANSCNAGFSGAVRDAGAHYVLALKGNRGTLHRHVEKLFAEAAENEYRGMKRHVTKNGAMAATSAGSFARSRSNHCRQASRRPGPT